jgi:hypothetical protein
MRGEGDELLTIRQQFGRAAITVNREQSRLLLAERRCGSIRHGVFRWLTVSGRAVAQLDAGQGLQLVGRFGIEDVEIEAEQLAAREPGAAVALFGQAGIVETKRQPDLHGWALRAGKNRYRSITVLQQAGCGGGKLRRPRIRDQHMAVTAGVPAARIHR